MAVSRYSPLEGEAFGAQTWQEVHIRDADGVLAIALETEAGQNLKLVFAAYLAFRKMDESDAVHTLEDIAVTSEPGTRLYAVAESDYLRWCHFESDAIHKGQKLNHYCVATLDSIIDVISFDPPEVTSLRPSPAAS